MPIKEFIKEISSTKRKPVYLISGDDRISVKKALKAAKELLPPEAFDFNFYQYDMDTASWAQVVAEASTMPFGAEFKIVLATSFTSIQNKDANFLLDYVNDPNPQTLLLLFPEKIDNRLKIFKELKKIGKEFIYSLPKDKRINIWLQNILKEKSILATNDVINLMLDRCIHDSLFLESEVEKIATYLGGSGTLTKELVEILIPSFSTGNIFNFCEALADQDRPKAMTLLLKLLSEGEHLRIVAMIIRHFRILLKIKNLLSLKEYTYSTSSELGKELELHPFVVEKAMPQARQWSWFALMYALQELEKTHLALVSSYLDNNLILENLALKLLTIDKRTATPIYN